MEDQYFYWLFKLKNVSNLSQIVSSIPHHRHKLLWRQNLLYPKYIQSNQESNMKDCPRLEIKKGMIVPAIPNKGSLCAMVCIFSRQGAQCGGSTVWGRWTVVGKVSLLDVESKVLQRLLVLKVVLPSPGVHEITTPLLCYLFKRACFCMSAARDLMCV